LFISAYKHSVSNTERLDVEQDTSWAKRRNVSITSSNQGSSLAPQNVSTATSYQHRSLAPENLSTASSIQSRNLTTQNVFTASNNQRTFFSPQRRSLAPENLSTASNNQSRSLTPQNVFTASNNQSKIFSPQIVLTASSYQGKSLEIQIVLPAFSNQDRSSTPRNMLTASSYVNSSFMSLHQGSGTELDIEGRQNGNTTQSKQLSMSTNDLRIPSWSFWNDDQSLPTGRNNPSLSPQGSVEIDRPRCAITQYIEHAKKRKEALKCLEDMVL